MRPISVTVGPLAAASATAICASQTPTSAFTLNGSIVTGGVAILDTARRVLFTTVANESAKTATIVGTDVNGSITSEVLTLPNATTAFSVMDYKTVTSITISASATGAITVGTNGVASSMWVRLDDWAPAQTSVQATVTGTVNYTVQQTLDDPNGAMNSMLPYQVVWFSSPDSTLVGATGNIQSNYAFAPTFVRVLLNSGGGTVTLRVLQSGVVTQ